MVIKFESRDERSGLEEEKKRERGFWILIILWQVFERGGLD